MSDQQIKSMWSIFRVVVGMVLLGIFTYMVVTDGNGESEILMRLLTLLIGIIQVGQGGGSLISASRTNNSE